MTGFSGGCLEKTNIDLDFFPMSRPPSKELLREDVTGDENGKPGQTI